MNIVFMSMDTLPSTLWARDLYDQMHIRSDFRKWFPRMCQYGFIEGRDYEYMPRVRLQDEGGRTVQRYVKDYRITQDMAKKLCKLHHTAVGAAYHPQPFDWDALLGLLHKKPPRRSSYEAQLSDSDSLVTTTQIAKEYGCGAKVFNRLLHLHGIQYRANGQWVLYSEHHGKGYTSSLTFRLQRSDDRWLREQCTEEATAHWWQMVGAGSVAYQAGRAETERAAPTATAGAKS